MDGSLLARMGFEKQQLSEMKAEEFPISDDFWSVGGKDEKRFPKLKSENGGSWTVQVSSYVRHTDFPESQMPSPRTYHASTLVDRFMVVVGGESNSSDLNDFWALDLEQKKWYKPDIFGQESFIPKRFHTANTIQGTKVITFGGCHSEYVHLNDLNVFEMKDFVESQSAKVICTKVNISLNVPSTRWGHAAAVMDQDKLFILGGRNDSDVSDIHCYDIVSNHWHQIEVGHQIPSPRRRHSCIFVSNCLVMFGGFDGEFFNDINIMDMSAQHQAI
jgi:N-acetylneuraminic acid mutarotase